MGMRVGYARTSTTEQKAGFEAQQRNLSQAGCEQIFAEQVSSVARREQLEAAIKFLRKGDTLVVTALDRLARSVSDLVNITRELENKGVALHVLSLNLDTATPTGKLMINMLGSVAQFEREIMLERQREGIAKAKNDGKYKGRKPTARAKTDEIKALKAEGLGATEIAKSLNIGVASVYRALQQA